MIFHKFIFEKITQVFPASGWKFSSGFFINQELLDLFGYFSGDGSLWVGRNTRSNFIFEQWGAVSPKNGWQFVVGNFTRSDKSEIVGYHQKNGILWLGENHGSQFVFREWGRLAPAHGWELEAGSFTTRDRSDIFAYHSSKGSLWVGKNTGAQFNFEKWGSVTPVNRWKFKAGNFSYGARSEIVGYHPGNGSIWVGENLGNRFEFRQWATVDPVAGWKFAAGDFTGQNEEGLLGYYPGNGTVWVGENKGSSFAFQKWAIMDPGNRWQLIAGRFNGITANDVIGYHPKDGSIWMGRSSYRPIEGYCWPLSVTPGQNLSFMISGEGRCIASFSRHVSTSSSVDSIHMTDIVFSSMVQPVPFYLWRTGCDWAETFKFNIPQSWVSGIYSAVCTDGNGSQCEITFIVKSKPSLRSGVAVLANINTWLAYNDWGGESKYTGAAKVSFLRPNAGTKSSLAGSMHLTRGELWILGYIENQGIHPDSYTDLDFHNAGCDATQYKCLVLSTHPEYWTVQMYDNLKTYLANGGSVLYLGGNGIYEIAEYDLAKTGMSFRRGVENGPRVDALFRVSSTARAERAILGVATERCGVVGSAYRVKMGNHFLFNHTGLATGDLFGEAGYNTGAGNGKASGWEVDTSNGPGALTIPIDCATEDGVVPPSVAPAGLVILAQGEPDAAGPGADMTYYEHPGGGFVFSVGSITFGGSLVVDIKMQKLLRNVFAKAGVL